MTKNKSNSVLYIGIAVAIGIVMGSLLDFNKGLESIYTQNKSETKVRKLINYIEYDYVDEVDTDSLLDGAIEQILTHLDPHSVYIPKDELQRVQESMKGNFKGIGIQFRMIRDSVTILNVIKGGPSELAGLLAGDRILTADQDTVFGKSYSSMDIMKRLKGSDKEKVALTIYRKQQDSLLKFNFNRGDVNLISVPIYYMINDVIGFVKIDRFARNTYDEFHTALLNLKEQGMQTLILDLRGNTGGYMDIANDIVDEFLGADKLIVFTKNKKDKISKSFATEKGGFEQGKLYVLIDENSASASEIVAGALQDNDKGTIVGRRSFGKGLVQQEMDLGDGSAVRLTTARYYTPTGRSIQKPYDHKGSKNYSNDKLNRMHNGELYYRDSIPIIDSLKYTTPKGKVVYGGGGIIPDVFVPMDSSNSFYTHHNINTIGNFIFDYIDEDRGKYNAMSWEEFVKTYDSDAVLNRYLDTMEIKYKDNDYTFLRLYLKALIARELYSEMGFYRVWEEKDLMVQKVLELEGS